MKTITILSTFALAILAAPNMSAASPAHPSFNAAPAASAAPAVALKVFTSARTSAALPMKSAQSHDALVPMTKQKCKKCKCKTCKNKGYKGKKYKCKKCKCKKCELGGKHHCKKCKCKKC